MRPPRRFVLFSLMAAAAGVVFACGVSVPTASATGLLGRLPTGGQCVSHYGTGYVQVEFNDASYYEVEAPSGRSDLRAVARQIAPWVASSWTRWAERFRERPPPNGLQAFDVAAAWEIFVVPSDVLPPGIDSATIGYCSPLQSAAVLMPNQPEVALRGAIAHELFHMFQRGQVPDSQQSGWWTEATAEWGRFSTVTDVPRREIEDRLFLRHPELPIDAPLSPGQSEVRWEARWRFVEFLADDLGGPVFWRVLNDTFAVPGLVQDSQATSILSQALAGQGLSFGTELGRFWGLHLADGTTAGLGETPPYNEDREVALTPESIRASADLHAANVGRIRLAGNVGQATITISPLPDGGKLWVRLGSNAPDDLSSSPGTHTYRFCVHGSAPGTKPWPGSMAFAYTNTGGFGATATGVTFQITPDPDPCSRDRTCRAAGAAEGFLAFLAPSMSCPAPRPANGCGTTARRGVYDTSASVVSTIPREFLYVLCNPHPYVYGFGGTASCNGTSSGVPVSLGPSGAGELISYSARGPGAIHNGHFRFSYTYEGSQIEVDGNITPTQAAGTVHAVARDCTLTQSWTAPYRGR